tara:strand:+ start:34 stop:225 length:192 start_codon:yes stop_codon:yes gene_type:complete
MDLSHHSRGMCRKCYNKNYRKRNDFIYRVGKPLKLKEVLHNAKELYRQQRYWKRKKKEKSISF